MIWIGIVIGVVGVAIPMIAGHAIGYNVAKSEDEHHDLSIENGYLKLLCARMGEIRAAHKGIQRLRRKLDRTTLKLRRAGRPLHEREPPHCPTCHCPVAPLPCLHDDPSWCGAECERWRRWVKDGGR